MPECDRLREFDRETVRRFHRAGWWDARTVADMVAANAAAATG